MTKTTVLFAAVVTLIVGVAVGYWYGTSAGYQRGYDKAVADTKATQEAIAQKAGADAANAANPFKETNPLEGVTVNPFEDAAKKLNPFAK